MCGKIEKESDIIFPILTRNKTTKKNQIKWDDFIYSIEPEPNTTK